MQLVLGAEVRLRARDDDVVDPIAVEVGDRVASRR
jgi:hypothetical protein